MDETDPNIFDESGYCNHCQNYYKNIEPFLNNENEKKNFRKKYLK